MHTTLDITSNLGIGHTRAFMEEKRGSVRVPMHVWCRKKLGAISIMAWLAIIAVIGVTYWLMNRFDIQRFSLERYVLEFGMLLVALFVISLFAEKGGLIMERKDERVIYTFGSKDYSHEFAELNGTVVDA